MTGKIAVLLLVISCLAQGFAADVSSSSGESNEIQSSYENVRTIDEVVKLINQLLASIKDALKNADKIVADLQEKIKEIINGINISGIVKEIADKVKEILDAAGVTVDKAGDCIKAEKNAVEELVVGATDRATACLKDANTIVSDILKIVANLGSKATSVTAAITSSVTKCFTDNVINPIKLLKCLQGLIEPTTNQVKSLVDEINKTVEDIQKVAVDAVEKVTNCAANISKEVINAETNIINEFKKCVENIAN